MTTIIQLDRTDLQELIEASIQRAISGVNFQKTDPPQDRISLAEVMKMTGKSKQWHYQKTTRGCEDPLPYQKFGRQLIFSRKAIQEYIDSHTKSITLPEAIMTDRLSKTAKKRL